MCVRVHVVEGEQVDHPTSMISIDRPPKTHVVLLQFRRSTHRSANPMCSSCPQAVREARVEGEQLDGPGVAGAGREGDAWRPPEAAAVLQALVMVV